MDTRRKKLYAMPTLIETEYETKKNISNGKILSIARYFELLWIRNIYLPATTVTWIVSIVVRAGGIPKNSGEEMGTKLPNGSQRST